MTLLSHHRFCQYEEEVCLRRGMIKNVRAGRCRLAAQERSGVFCFMVERWLWLLLANEAVAWRREQASAWNWEDGKKRSA
jgi:hypothetical protein